MNWTDRARRQQGVIGRSQLTSLGYTRDQIGGMLRRGRLERTRYERVYRAAGCPDTPDAASWAAVLATNSPLSYLSAALIWDLPVPPDGQIHITRLDRRRLDWPARIRVHRVALDRGAVTEHCGLQVTTRTETLLDCLGWLQPRDSRTLADRAQQQRWLAPTDVQRRLDEQPGRWGNRRLRALVPYLGDGAHSQAERVLHQLLRRAGLTGWRANYPVTISARRYVIDVAFPAQQIAVEVDGYRTHSQPDSFQGDRTKGVVLSTAGWTMLRFTWSDLVDRADYVVAAISSLLAA